MSYTGKWDCWFLGEASNSSQAGSLCFISGEKEILIRAFVPQANMQVFPLHRGSENMPVTRERHARGSHSKPANSSCLDYQLSQALPMLSLAS